MDGIDSLTHSLTHFLSHYNYFFSASQLHVHYNHNNLQWKTVSGRSKQYTEKMLSILGDNAHISSPITAVKKVSEVWGIAKYEIFRGEEKTSMGNGDWVRERMSCLARNPVF